MKVCVSLLFNDQKQEAAKQVTELRLGPQPPSRFREYLGLDPFSGESSENVTRKHILRNARSLLAALSSSATLKRQPNLWDLVHATETSCWMNSIFTITQYLKSIITPLSHRTFSSSQTVKGIHSNLKKASENLTTPLASAFQMALLDKTLLRSAFPRKYLRCSEEEGTSEQRSHTSHRQLLTAVTALNSEHGLTSSHRHTSLPSAPGAIQSKATW